MAGVRWLCSVAAAGVVLLLATSGNGAPVDGWAREFRVIARVGAQVISTYDLMLVIAHDRMLSGADLEPPPLDTEWRQALSRKFSQLVILEAAEMRGAVFPDPAQIRDVGDQLLKSYGDGDPRMFWRRTGIPFQRVQDELRRRSVVERYVQDVIAPSVRVTQTQVDQVFNELADESGFSNPDSARERIQSMLLFRGVRDQLMKLRERYIERTDIKILDSRYTRRDLIDAEDPSDQSLKPIP